MSQVFKLYSIYILNQIFLLPSYLFIFGCSGSWLLLLGFLYLRQVGLLSLQRADFPCRWPLVAEHRLQGLEAAVAAASGSAVLAQGHWSMGTAVTHRLSCFEACGVFLAQGSSLCPLHWQEDPYPLDYQGSLLHLLTTKDCINIFF